MTYLVSQLWFCLLLAWMLGNIVGWLLRGGCSAHIKRVEKNWRDRYLTLEEEKERYVAQVNQLQLADDETDTLTKQLAKYQEIERLNSKLRSHVKDVEIGAQVIQADLRAKTQALAKCQKLLAVSKKAIHTKDDTLQKLAKKLKIERHQLNRYQRHIVEYRSQDNKRVEEVKIALDKRDDELSSVQALLTEKEQSLTALTTTITTKNEELVAYEAQLAEQTDTVKIRDEMVEYYEKQLEESTATNTTLSNKLEGLANEFAKVASALMQAKSTQTKENERYQATKVEKEELTLKLQTIENQLADTDKALVEKEQELKTLQEKSAADTQSTATSSPSKLRKLERQLKQMKKKLKAASDTTQAVIQTDNHDSDKEAQDFIALLGINYEIEKIRGVGSGHGQRLRKQGITNSHDLLQQVISNKDAQTLAQKVSCKPTDILWWKKMADFLRIKGVTAEFAQLLALSHLHSVRDVALSNAMQLLDKMKAARKKERRIRHLPELEDINEWIHEAKALELD